MGGLTPQQVQIIADLTKKDQQSGADMSVIDELAAIGSHGEISGNCARDLKRHIPKGRLPPPRYHRIPCRHKVVGRGNPKLPLIYPQEFAEPIPLLPKRLLYQGGASWRG